MPHEQHNSVTLIGPRSVIRFLKEKKMDIRQIVKETRDISGTPFPPDKEWNYLHVGVWDFYVVQESSKGMEVSFCTNFAAYAIEILEYLVYKFPDLYVRAEYKRHGRDTCFSGIWQAQTREGKVVIDSVCWGDEEVAGCCAAPDAYDPYWYVHNLNGTYEVADTRLKQETAPTEAELLEKAEAYFTQIADKPPCIESALEDIQRNKAQLVALGANKGSAATLLQPEPQAAPSQRQPQEDAKEVKPVAITKKRVVIKKKISKNDA